MTFLPHTDQKTPPRLRELSLQLLSQVDSIGRKIQRFATPNEPSAAKIALLKQHEQLSADQGSRLNADSCAIDAGLKAARTPDAPAEPRQQPKHRQLSPPFARGEIHYQPQNTEYTWS